MNKLKSLYRLFRIDHGVLLAVAVVIGQLITTGTVPGLKILFLSIVTPIAISSSAFAINDYVDYETDKTNERLDRPLVSGELKRKTALYLSLILAPVGIISSVFINTYAVTIAVLFALISYAYALYLEKLPLIGNISIAASMAIPFVFGSLTMSNVVPIGVWILSTMVFLTGLGREIVKSVQDIKGDREHGRRTLPMKIGIKSSVYIATVLIATAMILSPVPFFIVSRYAGSYLYLFLSILTDLVFLTSLEKLLVGNRYGYFRRTTFIAFGVGLLAFLLPIL